MRKIQLLVILALCAAPSAIACETCDLQSYSQPGWAHLAPFAIAMFALFAMTLSGLDVWESLSEFFTSRNFLKPQRSD